MRRYITLFYIFLGNLTFIFLIGAAAVIYIGHRKSQAAEAAVMTNQDGQAVSMSPAKQADTLTTQVQTLPHFQPISRKPVSASKQKPVQRKPTTVVSAKPAPTPATYAAPKVRQTVIVEKAKPKPAKPRPTKQPATTVHAALGLPEELPRRYQATDNGASRRTGSLIPDVTAPPSKLEQQAIRHARNIRQLEEETAKLRNPPVEETDLMKLLSGGEK